MASQNMNSNAQNSQKPQGLPNPYASRLPNPYAAATVASAPPVKYTEEQARAQQQLKNIHAFHNPHAIKRPQAKSSGNLPKKPVMPSVSTNPAAATANKPATKQHGIDYYRSTVDDDAAVMEERRQRKYMDNQRKKEQKKFTKQYGHYNGQDSYRGEHGSNLKAYTATGGWSFKRQAFQEHLKNLKAEADRACSTSSTKSRPVSSPESPPQQAPKAKLSFAPPASYDPATATAAGAGDSEEDPYEKRLRMSQQQSMSVPPPPPSVNPGGDMSMPFAQQPSAMSVPLGPDAGTTTSDATQGLERPNVRVRDSGEPVSEGRPAKRPRTGGFGKAMLEKMGWQKGQGLGKNNDGVTTHLEVKKKPQKGVDSFNEDGVKIKGQQIWEVQGGLRTKEDEPGKFGKESAAIVAWGCIDGTDWMEDAQRDDGGIRQEMGDQFTKKFGPVERIHIDQGNEAGVVYIKFSSDLSALNAVNRFDEGYEFRGRKIRCQYYPVFKFENAIWDY